MDPPRVFLICVNQLVCEAVNVLLRREGIVLLGMETDPKVGLDRVRTLNPDIVLVEGFSPHPETLGQAGSTKQRKASRKGNGKMNPSGSKLMSALARLVYEKENLRIIRLSLPDEDLLIYRQEHRRFINTHDLVAAIRSAGPAENI